MNFIIIGMLFHSVIIGMFIAALLEIKNKNSLKINFYNLPIIIFCTMFLVSTIYVCLYKFLSYIPFGIFLGILFFAINSVTIENIKPSGITNRIIFSIFICLSWPYVLIFLLFLLLNLHKINFDEKS